MIVIFDEASLSRLRFRIHTRRRTYLVCQPPILGIIVIKFAELSIPDLCNLIADCSTGYERGIEPFVPDEDVGQKHGKLTAYRIVDQAPETSMSEVIAFWREQEYVIR